MNVLVTGGAGYIGSVVTEELIEDGHRVCVYDNLSKGHREAVDPQARFVEGDLLETDKLIDIFRAEKTEAVIHLAASSLVGESVQKPAKYYHNNVTAGLSLLQAMETTGVRKLVFSSTAAVYGEPEKQPIEERDAACPTNPYGETKLAFENILKWFENAGILHYVSLRYFNAAGATKRCGEMHDPETHLIPIVLQVAAGEREAVEVYGNDYATVDGTCVRDYIHVYDLARAHIVALNILESRSAIYNLGCGGNGYSVNEVIEAARQVTGKKISVQYAARRSGDPSVLIASSEKIKQELGWTPVRQNLTDIIESAWQWKQNQQFHNQEISIETNHRK